MVCMEPEDCKLVALGPHMHSLGMASAELGKALAFDKLELHKVAQHQELKPLQALVHLALEPGLKYKELVMAWMLLEVVAVEEEQNYLSSPGAEHHHQY